MARTWWDRRQCRTTPTARTPSWSAHCVAWSMLLACSWDFQFSWSPTSPFPWLQQARSQHLYGHFIRCAAAAFWILEGLASSTKFYCSCTCNERITARSTQTQIPDGIFRTHETMTSSCTSSRLAAKSKPSWSSS